MLAHPGLEQFRDLAATGQIETVLVYSPDRLSRKYAYQILLVEGFARHGVEVVFIQSPKAQTPEEQLLLQFQSMISEYEHAQIAERTRRGKRHRAKGGSVNVLSGAPYGYRYVEKTENTEAYYEILSRPSRLECTAYVASSFFNSHAWFPIISKQGKFWFHLKHHSNFEEPRAVVPNAGICTGAVG